MHKRKGLEIKLKKDITPNDKEKEIGSKKEK